jgi:hypothetical protein
MMKLLGLLMITIEVLMMILIRKTAEKDDD